MKTKTKLDHYYLSSPGYKKDSYTIIKQIRTRKNGRMVIFYECRCDCGSINLLTKNNLEVSKGCAECKGKRCRQPLDSLDESIGYKKYGYTILEIIRKRDLPFRTTIFYKCRCDCGLEKLISRANFQVTKGCRECFIKKAEPE